MTQLSITDAQAERINRAMPANRAVDLGGIIQSLQDASGTFTPAANQADSTATDATGLKTDFNALLAKLKAAGLMEDDG